MSPSLNTNQEPEAGPDDGSASGVVTRALCDVLANGIDIHRCLAAKALGRLGDPDAVEPLIKALLDEDEDVRTDAAEALLALSDPAAADQLLENLLGDPCTDVKLAAMSALARMQDQRVSPWLRRLLKGRDEEIVWDEEEFFVSGWDDWVEIQVRSVQALADLNAAEAVPDIIDAICAENAQDMSEAAFQALARLGLPGIDALAGFMEQGDSRFRRRAAAALAEIEHPDAQDALALGLADKSADVRIAALRARAIQASDDPKLKSMLADPDPEIRALATDMIGQHYPDILSMLVDDRKSKVQVAAIKAAGRIKDAAFDESFIISLSEKVLSENEATAIAACGALANLSPISAKATLSAVLSDTDNSLPTRLGALHALETLGADATSDVLIGVLDDEERQIRLETASTLAKWAGTHESWPNPAGSALLAALGGTYDPDPVEPPQTFHAEEAELPQDDVVEEPVEDEFVPTSTLDSILNDAPELASFVGLPEIGENLSPEDMERLAIARQVVGKKKMRPAPEVVRHDDIRQFAARVLGDLSQDDVISALASVLNQDDIETGRIAADSLARIGARSTRFDQKITMALLSRVDTDDRDLKLALIKALAACGDDQDVVSILVANMTSDDQFVQVEAVQALAGKVRPQEILRELMNHADPSVRMSAATALAEDNGHDATGQLVDFASSFEGYHSRQTAQILGGLDVARANEAFLDILADTKNRRIWSVAIEALDEINQHRTERAA